MNVNGVQTCALPIYKEDVKKIREKQIWELSKQLEIKYMGRFIGSEVLCLPEVKKDDYLIGHTGNYLSVKLKSNKELTHNLTKCTLKSIQYPFVIGE